MKADYRQIIGKNINFLIAMDENATGRIVGDYRDPFFTEVSLHVYEEGSAVFNLKSPRNGDVEVRYRDGEYYSHEYELNTHIERENKGYSSENVEELLNQIAENKKLFEPYDELHLDEVIEKLTGKIDKEAVACNAITKTFIVYHK